MAGIAKTVGVWCINSLLFGWMALRVYMSLLLDARFYSRGSLESMSILLKREVRPTTSPTKTIIPGPTPWPAYAISVLGSIVLLACVDPRRHPNHMPNTKLLADMGLHFDDGKDDYE